MKAALRLQPVPARLPSKRAGQLAQSFISLAMFGLALSLPLAMAFLHPPMRRMLSKLLESASRWPVIIGILFVALGLWSVYFGLAVNPAGANAPLQFSES